MERVVGFGPKKKNRKKHEFQNAKIGSEKLHISFERNKRSEKAQKEEEQIEENTGVEVILTPKLSVLHNKVKLIGISDDVLGDLWTKSETLLQKPRSVVKAHGFERYVGQHSKIQQ